MEGEICAASVGRQVQCADSFQNELSSFNCAGSPRFEFGK
jgi:hypothetical protein